MWIIEVDRNFPFFSEKNVISFFCVKRVYKWQLNQVYQKDSASESEENQEQLSVLYNEDTGVLCDYERRYVINIKVKFILQSNQKVWKLVKKRLDDGL